MGKSKVDQLKKNRERDLFNFSTKNHLINLSAFEIIEFQF